MQPSSGKKRIVLVMEVLDIKREVETLSERLGKTQDYL
jgi:hypothetical protein